MHKNSIVLTAAVVVMLAASRPCVGQFGGGTFGNGGPDLDGSIYRREVLVEGANDLSRDVVAIIARTLSQRIQSSVEADATNFLVGLDLVPERASVSNDLQFWVLVISYRKPNGEDFDEKHVRELWDKAREQMEAALRQVQRTALDRRHAELDREHSRLNSVKNEYEQKANNAVAKLLVMDSNSSGTPEQTQQQLADTVNQLWQLKLDRISIAARREAIEQRIDYLRKLADESVDQDPVLAELQKIVDIREQQLAISKQLFESGAGQTSAGDVRQADAAVAEARIELLKAKRAAARDANGTVLAALNDELSKLFVQDAELKARGSALEEMVDGLQERASVVTRTDIERAEQDLKRLRSGLDATEQAMLDLGSRRNEEREISIRPLDEALPAEAAK
jgi:hypothetical protein